MTAVIIFALAATVVVAGILSRTFLENKRLEAEEKKSKVLVTGDFDIQDVMGAIKMLSEENKQIMRRLQNVEAIITSQAWEQLQSTQLPQHLSDTEQAEWLAKQIQSNANRV